MRSLWSCDTVWWLFSYLCMVTPHTRPSVSHHQCQCLESLLKVIRHHKDKNQISVGHLNLFLDCDTMIRYSNRKGLILLMWIMCKLLYIIGISYFWSWQIEFLLIMEARKNVPHIMKLSMLLFMTLFTKRSAVKGVMKNARLFISILTRY